MKSKKTQTFIKQATEAHGDKYNYDKVVVEKMSKKVIIECPVHGEISISPRRHIEMGCQHCVKEALQEAIATAKTLSSTETEITEPVVESPIEAIVETTVEAPIEAPIEAPAETTVVDRKAQKQAYIEELRRRVVGIYGREVKVNYVQEAKIMEDYKY